MPEIITGYSRNIYKVLSSDTDRFQHMKLSVLLRLLQEASISGTEAAGVTRDRTLDKGMLWVLTSMHLVLERPVSYDEIIAISSWPGDMRHVFFPRHFAIHDADGAIIMRGIQLWLLMDQKTRRMIMPASSGIFIPGFHQEGELPFPSAPKKVEGEEQITERTASFSELDLNGHVNNSVYMNWIDDILGGTYFKDYFLSDITLAFHQEIHEAEAVKIHHVRNNENLFFDVQREKGTAFQASLVGRKL